MPREVSSRRAHKFLRYGALIFTGVLIVMLVAFHIENPEQHLQTDWTAFDTAADRLVSGETIYRPWDADTEPLPYLYPPFVLWLALPLSLFGLEPSYALSAIGTLLAFIGGVRFFGRLGDPGDDRVTGGLLAICSGAAVGATLIGQYSGLYLLFLGAGAYLFARDRRTAAGLVLALLWIKPNIAVAVPVVLMWSRSWKTLRSFGLGSGALVISSIPFGLGQWGAFLDSARGMAELQEEGAVPVDKMVTLLSSIQTTFGLEAQVAISGLIWLVIAGVLGISVLAPWTRERLEQDPLRAFGALALFVVAANPRLYFYDAAVAALGMYGVWMSATRSGSPLVKRWLPILGLTLWLGLWGTVWSGLNVLVGPVSAGALILVAIDCVKAAGNSVAEESDDSDLNHSSRVFPGNPHGNSESAQAA